MAPKGWRLIDRYWQDTGGFHHVEFLRANADGSAQRRKTQRRDLGRQLEDAYQRQIPVAIASTGEWIDAVCLLPADYEVNDVPTHHG